MTCRYLTVFLLRFQINVPSLSVSESTALASVLSPFGISLDEYACSRKCSSIDCSIEGRWIPPSKIPYGLQSEPKPDDTGAADELDCDGTSQTRGALENSPGEVNTLGVSPRESEHKKSRIEVLEALPQTFSQGPAEAV